MGVCERSTPMQRSRGRALEKDQAFRGEILKNNYKLSRQGLLTEKKSLLCGCDRLIIIIITKKYIVKYKTEWK